VHPTESIQSTFLHEVRAKLPPNISFADELAELLNISRDSAYRRIRGETVLSLDEVTKICSHYRLSLDDLLAPSPEMVSFHQRAIHPVHFPFEMWLKSVLSNLEMISSFPHKEIFYAAKDVPFFHYYKFTELAAFKMFFWMKLYHGYPSLANSKFNREMISEDLLHTGNKIWTRYSNIPSTEIWSNETINVTPRQIRYCYETGDLTTAQAHQLCDEYLALTEHILQCAKVGSKGGEEGKFNLFKNDILIPETTIFFRMGEKRVAYVTYNTMNVLTTSQDSFCRQIEAYLMNVVNKSELISSTGEKERSKFFNRIQESISMARKSFA
jgi:Cro/C1-type HTH DNA-binding domain